MCRLSGYHIMIVSKYLKTIIDFIKLELVCKKFGGNMEKFYFNPIPLNSKTIRYFPNIETLHFYNDDENFGNGFMINTKENEDSEVVLREFYRIIVWFNVDFETINRNKSRNIEFKNVTYTQNDRKKFGNNIPQTVISIGNDCFSGCSSLSSITIPLSVTSFGDRCFSGCINLNSITVPFGVTSIGNGCFYGCSNLISVNIPSNLTSINNFCFDGCSSLSSITIPLNVTSIGYMCFYKCNSLSSVIIPSSVKYIGEDSFPSNTVVYRSK
ncbi:hypothetical protein EIN_426380 [Entamoeba invadens IP1]|uniref:Leucine rich repeat containing protein BspA family protein n=1 Tax=Entamoeba invadens IP1 TaxID=370355 RepID=A0A0A1U9L1_ENTIV|nr:hypothetical protein EIN_426380 [Entamoeba invadens IP1]ELP89826.1 hypothetical protein EIN_426380 [Entamoeba invadens IP1]|eukprot:XP_004256597.1 hypothetical protein EIN_426380 [Entamoeba invadens IP1]